MATKKRWIQKAIAITYTWVMKITLTCDFCKKSFERFAAWVNKNSDRGANFCSRTCSSKGKYSHGRTMVDLTCEHCGETKSFRVGRERAKFCSRACKNAARRGAAYERKRDGNYRIWRRAVIERDLKCVRCGRADLELHAHHKKSYSENPSLRYDLNNGEALCVDCHIDEHPNIAYLIKNRQRPTFIKVCPVCTGKFLSNQRRTVYCSRKCSAFAKRIENGGLMVCEGCKEEFLTKPSRRRGERKFCSRKCSQKWIGSTQGGRRDAIQKT